MLLLLEGLGFDALLRPPLPPELLPLILQRTYDKATYNAWRCTCRLLSSTPKYVVVEVRPLPRLLPVPQPLGSTAKYVAVEMRSLPASKPKRTNTPTEIKSTESICRVQSHVLTAIQTTNYAVLEQERKNILYQARFPELIKYVLEYLHTEVLFFLLEMFMASIPPSTAISNEAALRRGRLKILKRIKELLKVNRHRLDCALYEECLLLWS